MRKSQRLFIVSTCAAALLTAGAGAASAGEVTGGGKVTGAVENSNSICSYSGLNDAPGPITQTPANEGSPGAAGGGTCAGGSNHNRDKD